MPEILSLQAKLYPFLPEDRDNARPCQIDGCGQVGQVGCLVVHVGSKRLDRNVCVSCFLALERGERA